MKLRGRWGKERSEALHFSHDLIAGGFLLAFYFGFVLVLLEACVALADYSFDLWGM
jgi:hypothetical protein